MTPRELADFLKLSLPTVRRYVSNGTLPFLTIGNRVRFEPEAVLRALREQSAATANLKKPKP